MPQYTVFFPIFRRLIFQWSFIWLQLKIFRPTFIYFVKTYFSIICRSVRNMDESVDAINQTDTQIWSHLFKITVNLVRQLYTRDTRRQFCPVDHWINDRITLPLDRPHDISFRRSRLRQYRPFQGLRVFTREELGNIFFYSFAFFPWFIMNLFLLKIQNGFQTLKT